MFKSSFNVNFRIYFRGPNVGQGNARERARGHAENPQTKGNQLMLSSLFQETAYICVQTMRATEWADIVCFV
jgi:hypothetical protein